MKCMDCPLKCVGHLEGCLTLDTKSTYTISELITVNRICKQYTSIKHWTCIRNNNRHHGDNENRKKRKIFEHIRKILYL
jgi:hypothetical protein